MNTIPYVSIPEHFARLLVTNITPTSHTTNQLENYLTFHKELSFHVKKIFRDIDPDGFLGKIISIAGWNGVRNRLAALYIEYYNTGKFPETVNLEIILDIINIENKLRHFAPLGNSRGFLFGFYAKLAMINLKKIKGQKVDLLSKNTLILKEEHFEFMKFSKTKSQRIDWLMIQLIQLDYFLGTERMNEMLKSGMSYESIFAMLSEDEQKKVIQNCLIYGASIFDTEFFTQANINQ